MQEKSVCSPAMAAITECPEEAESAWPVMEGKGRCERPRRPVSLSPFRKGAGARPGADFGSNGLFSAGHVSWTLPGARGDSLAKGAAVSLASPGEAQPKELSGDAFHLD